MKSSFEAKANDANAIKDKKEENEETEIINHENKVKDQNEWKSNSDDKMQKLNQEWDRGNDSIMNGKQVEIDNNETNDKSKK